MLKQKGYAFGFAWVAALSLQVRQFQQVRSLLLYAIEQVVIQHYLLIDKANYANISIKKVVCPQHLSK